MESRINKDYLVDAFRGCTADMASRESKDQLFRIHRKLFPETKTSTEIAWNLCKMANAKSLLALPENKVPELENRLWKSKEIKDKLFALHKEVFPEIKSEREIIWRLCRLARVTLLTDITEEMVPELVTALWAILEARTAPETNSSNN